MSAPPTVMSPPSRPSWRSWVFCARRSRARRSHLIRLRSIPAMCLLRVHALLSCIVVCTTYLDPWYQCGWLSIQRRVFAAAGEVCVGEVCVGDVSGLGLNFGQCDWESQCVNFAAGARCRRRRTCVRPNRGCGNMFRRPTVFRVSRRKQGP